MSEPAPPGDAVWRRAHTGQGLAYRFLARCFHEPPRKEWLATLVEQQLFEAWPFPSDEEDVSEGLHLLASFCERWDPATHDELVWDFNRLFVGPGEMLAPPWESVHRSKTRLTFQEPTLEVRGIYQQFGIEAPAIHREPDDHLALELAFFAHLSELATEAETRTDTATPSRDRCLEAQRDFLHDHLLAWVPGCLAMVLAHAETDYYRGAARVTLGSLAESARLSGVPRP